MVWISNHQYAAAKRAGVLAPFAKFPGLVSRMLSALAAGRSAGRSNSGGGGGGRADSEADVAVAAIALQRLAATVFQHLEGVAQRDPKYCHVVRLENYYFFSQSVGPQGAKCLENAVAQADAAFETATAAYLQWLASYQFPYLTQFFARIEDLVARCGAADVAFHENKKSLEAVLRKHGQEATIVEGLRATHARLVKHISRESGLLALLWDRLSDTLFAMFSRYEELCTVCYGHAMAPGASDVRRLASDVGGGGGGYDGAASENMASNRSDAEEMSATTSPRSVGSMS
ncbi:unnamed protein product, partial [Phaeothamnion confervicola]